MSNRHYLSDVSPWWTEARQREVLARSPHGVSDGQTFYDALTTTERRAHRPESLVERASMLRPTTRRSADTIFVASLAVLAWTQEDLLVVWERIAQRGATLVSEDDQMAFSPGTTGESLTKAWREARAKSRLEGSARRGARISGAKRRAAADEAVEKIRDRWGLPSSEVSTAELLREAGVSRNTVNARLGGRETAQRRYAAAQKRKAKRI